MKKSHLLFVSGLLLAGVSTGYSEMSYKGQTDIGIQFGTLMIEGDSNLDDATVFGGHIGRYFTENWGGEISIVGGSSDIERSSQKMNTVLTMGELQYHFGSSNLRPFLAAGLGLWNYTPQTRLGREPNDFVLDYGAGIKWMWTNWLGARADLRHVLNTESGNGSNNILATAGISIMFTNLCSCGSPTPIRKTPVQQVAKVVVAVADADRDGVLDDNDACPNTPIGTEVDAKGCTRDFDKDGVPDINDKCPNTPYGVEVDATGCPLDTDGDGVTDRKDDCPETPKGVEVNKRGCPKAAKDVPDAEWILDGVQFEVSADTIRSESKQALNDVVETLRNYSRVRVEIQGHTDSQGKIEANQKLSERRAKSVKKYLIEKGIAENRLETVGFGETRPIAENTTPAGRSKNRRIEFRVLSR